MVELRTQKEHDLPKLTRQASSKTGNKDLRLIHFHLLGIQGLIYTAVMVSQSTKGPEHALPMASPKHRCALVKLFQGCASQLTSTLSLWHA